MSKRNPRVPGTAALRSFAVPRCSVHGTPMQKDDAGQWLCLTCFDSWLEQYVRDHEEESVGGVQLPRGVHDERKRPAIRDLMLNRRVRRQMARAR